MITKSNHVSKAMLPVFIAVIIAFSSANMAPAAEIRLEFWYGEVAEAYIDAMEDIISEFEAINPGIKIDMVLKGTPTRYYDSIKTAIAAGVAPDVVYFDGFQAVEWNLHGNTLMQLDKLLPPRIIDEWNKNYLPGPRYDFTVNGKWYGVPLRTDTRGLYMNVDMVANAGLNHLRGPADTTELDIWAAKLTQYSPTGSVSVLGFAPNRNNYADELPWIWAFGGEFFDYQSGKLTFTSNPRNIEAVRWIQDYANRYGGTRAQSSETNFKAGKAAMHISSTTRLAVFAEIPELNWWTSFIPAAPGMPRVTLGSSLGPVIPVGAKHPEAAALVAAYMADPQVQLEFYKKTQALPTRSEALPQVIRLIDDPRERNLVQLLDITRVVPPLYSSLRVTWRSYLDKMRAGDISPLEVLENTQFEMEPMYAEAFNFMDR